MDCKDVDTILSEGWRLPRQAQEHVKTCRRCQEFVTALNTSTSVDPLSPEMLRHIVEGLAPTLRPVHAVAPAIYFFAAFLGIFLSIVALGVYRLRAIGIGVMTPLETSAILSALTISAVLLAYSLVRQMVPGSRHRLSPELLPAAIAIALTVAIVLLFPFKHEHNFWRNAWSCTRVGTPIGFLAAIPLWLILGRGSILSPAISGAATGLFGGLVGMTVLEIHCPNLDAWHILVSHLGVAIVCALAGLIAGWLADVGATRPNRWKT
jgi:hypothetical protein